MKRSILLIEDDPNLGQSLSERLAAEGFQVDRAETLSQANQLLKKSDTALIILDWMLPDGQGIDFLKEYRAQGGALPVLLLTSRADISDRVLGLETGANDYLTKPFDPRELIARVRVQLRIKSTAQKILTVAGIEIDLESRLVRTRGREIELTKMEFDLLRIFCENPKRVFTREELLNKVWGYERFPTTRTVDTHILQLRQKFGEERFETLRGVGYRLKS